MRTNRTSDVGVEFRSQEDAVTLAESSIFGNSNEQLTERHFKNNAVDANVKVRRCCKLLPWCVVVILAGVLVIVAEKNQKQKQWLPNAQASHFNSYLNADDGIDFRISSNKSSCVGPTCITCKMEIKPYIEPLHCPALHTKLKNGSCFLCGMKCLNIEDLLNITKQKQDNKFLTCQGRPIELTCCFLSDVGSLSHYCGERGQYSCYGQEREPVCLCPPGTKHCHKPYTDLGQCMCYKSKRKYCGQEQIAECTEVKKGWSTCHMTTSQFDDHYNCLCSKSTGNGDDYEWCPHSETDPDSKQKKE